RRASADGRRTMSFALLIRPGSQPPQPPDARDPSGNEHEDITRVAVTFFTDRTATTSREERLSLPELANVIQTTAAPTKEQLPWLKLARFGDHRSKGGALRNNDNVLAITGIESDYDRKQMSLADAKDIIARAGITALIYPSPSYTPGEPKWRVLCPLSRE